MPGNFGFSATVTLAMPKSFPEWVAEATVPQTQYSDDLTGMCYEAPTSMAISDSTMEAFGIKKCPYGCAMDGGSVQAGCLPPLSEQNMEEARYLALSGVLTPNLAIGNTDDSM